MYVWRNQNKMHLFTSVLLFCFLEVNALFFQFQVLPVRLQVKTERHLYIYKCVYIYIYIYIYLYIYINKYI